MTKDFLNLLNLLRFGVLGTKGEIDENTDLEATCELALKQGVLPMVYGTLSAREKKEINPKWEQMFFRAMIKNEQKMAALVGVIKKLEDAGISYCILKGYTVAKEYHLSELRLSGDIDLYVDPKDERKTSELLKSMGMTVEARPEGKQDFKVTSPAIGVIEVHVLLHGEVFNRDVLKYKFEITESFRDMEINDYLSVKALGINDTLGYLTAHFLKHFVREGSGIRQVTDLLAFVENHKNDIDFEKYFSILEEIRFKKLMLSVFGIGVKYFDMELPYYNADNIEGLLADIEAGENFGFGEEERNGFYERFLVKRTENEGGSRKAANRKKRLLLKAIFLPEKLYLIRKGYTYLEKSSLLYPVAYVHRLWNIVVSVVSRKKKIKKVVGFANAENDVISSRLKLMKDMDVI